MNIQKINTFLIAIIILAVLGIFGYRHFSRPKYVPLPPRPEINITIIPGWNLRQIATDWVKKGLIKNEDELYALVGEPAKNYRAVKTVSPVLDWTATGTLAELFTDKSSSVSYEGYFLPETYRVYADAKPEEIIKKIFSVLDDKIIPEMRTEAVAQKKTWFDILTMASVVEREAASAEDMKLVADIFWRRLQKNWALQSCATVNYVTGKNDPAVNAEDRQIDSFYNTYKYPGLPLGPIGNPSLKAINATLYPTKNDYWYFMSGTDGVMHYAKTLEEHNVNVAKYLR